MKASFLGISCIVVVCITLTLGLWPFHSPQNDLTWLRSVNGVAFDGYGTVLSSSPLPTTISENGASGSIEIWAQPERWSSSATILALYQPHEGALFTVHQSLADLEFYIAAPGYPARNPQLYVNDAFEKGLRENKAVIITVTSGRQGVAVYLDGALVKSASNIRIPGRAFFGRLILGDSPGQPDSFRGQIRGLAVYNVQLTANQVWRDCKNWMELGRPDASQDERNGALYLFDEQTGNVIHNHMTGGGDLYIPKTYSVADKIFLEPFWNEFTFSRSYWTGNVKNILGFIPVGFCFYAYLAITRGVTRATSATLVLGAALSLTIEVSQAFLPMRDSGTTDLITNTTGCYVGILCYTYIYPLLLKRFAWMDWFAERGSPVM